MWLDVEACPNVSKTLVSNPVDIYDVIVNPIYGSWMIKPKISTLYDVLELKGLVQMIQKRYRLLVQDLV